MLRAETRPEGTSDRERRERLESLQAQLKDARRQLAEVEGTASAVVRELEEAVTRANARYDAAQVRHDELQDRVRAARERLAALAREQRGDRSVDGLPAHQGRVKRAAPWFIPALGVVIAGALFVLSVMVRGCRS